MKRREGFILLEVILAVSILVVALFALIETMSRCVGAARSIRNYSVAEQLLANKSYEFRVERPTDYIPQDGSFEEYPDWKWSRNFERADEEGLWIQTITVTWQERGRSATDSVVVYRYLPEKTL